MQPRNLKLLTYIGYTFAMAAYVFMSAVAAHPYDDAIIDQHAQLFYHLGTNPLYYLPQGIYWDIINIGSYFPTVLLNIFGLQNIVTIHLATKSFLIVSAFLSSIYIGKIVELITGDKGKGTLALFLFIFNPIIFYTTAVYGSSIIIAVLFIIMATYFVIKGENILAAVFYGLSMGTFIYPLLGLPILFRYVQVKTKMPSALVFLGISLTFAALGQGPIFLFYLLHGSGLAGLPVGGGYLSTNVVYPPFSVFDIFNLYPVLKFSYLNYLFYSVAISSSFVFFLIRKENVNYTKLFIFLGIQGVIFSSLAAGGVLMSFPSSLVPFVILFAFSAKRYSIFVPLIVSFVTLSLAMETINNIGLPIYFLDLNHGVALHTIRVTSTETSLTGFFFGLSILSMFPFFLLRPGKEKKQHRDPIAATITSAVIVVVLIILAASIVAPVIEKVPSTYYLQDPISGYDTIAHESVLNGVLFLNYTVPILALTSQQSYEKITIQLQEPGVYFYFGSYNFTSLLTVKGNLSFPYQIDFPSNGARISIISNSQDIEMKFSNNSSLKYIEPTIANFNSYYVLSYPIGAVSADNYTITLSGSGSVGIYNFSGKYIVNGGQIIKGITVDAIFYFYQSFSDGTVNGVRVKGGETVTVPPEAYNYHLCFSFPGFLSQITPPLLVINFQYGNYSNVSLIEGALAFTGVIAATATLFFLRKR